MKATSKFYKGIEYVVVNELPSEQQALLNQINIEKIKILMDGKILSNCISYQEYSEWFHTVFKQRKPESKPVQKEVFTSVKVIFNKA